MSGRKNDCHCGHREMLLVPCKSSHSTLEDLIVARMTVQSSRVNQTKCDVVTSDLRQLYAPRDTDATMTMTMSTFHHLFLLKTASMSRLSLALSLSMAGLAAMPTSEALVQNGMNSRRSFVAKVGSAATMGWLLNLDLPHVNGCQCGQCGDSHATDCQCGTCAVGGFARHGVACECGSCAPLSFRPAAANAYERDVGGASRSPEQAAFNLQARETNARLEREGFKLDTKEEEAARLSEALSSFSYDASTSKQPGERGYGAKKTATAPAKK